MSSNLKRIISTLFTMPRILTASYYPSNCLLLTSMTIYCVSLSIAIVIYIRNKHQSTSWYSCAAPIIL